MLSLKHNIAASRRVNVTEENDDKVGYDKVSVEEPKEQGQKLHEKNEAAAANAIAYTEGGKFSEDSLLTDNLELHLNFQSPIIIEEDNNDLHDSED